MTVKEISGMALREIPKPYRWLIYVLGALLFGLQWGDDVAAVMRAPAQIQVMEARIDSMSTKVDDTHCYVKAMAGVTGYTTDLCALK